MAYFEEVESEEDTESYQNDMECLSYFLGLKSKYEQDRGDWETKWTQCRNLYFNNDRIDEVYNGRSNIRIPIIDTKVNGIVSRINRVLFSAEPFARIDSPKDQLARNIDEKFIELWNKYIFEYQLDEIDFSEAFKQSQKDKTILGTTVSKVTQEYEVKEFSYFDDEEQEEIVVKDNPYFKPILLEEFYTDVAKQTVYESQCNIHSTTISMEQLRSDEKRTVKVEEEVKDEMGQVVGTRQVPEEEGMYYNLNLVELNGNGLTSEQSTYLQNLGIGDVGSQEYEKKLKEQKKTGIIEVLECWGLYDIDGNGKQEECVVTIANGHVVIRKERTPFRHKKYTRPFIVGKYREISNCFYGESNVWKSYNLIQELNASRAQMIDAKTRSISPMWYKNTDMNVVWDGVWRPNGVIKGQGSNGFHPILNPYLGNVTAESIIYIERDLDKLWSQSPVQEGTTDNRLIPKTASGTAMTISQNDIPINEMIISTINNEIKPFIEMIFERNLQFKTEKDLMAVWSVEDLQGKGLLEKQMNRQTGQVSLVPVFNMKDLAFTPDISVLGPVELNNEMAHQAGYTAFLQLTQSIPSLAKRIDYKELTERFLRAYGIKDDSEGIFLPEEDVQEADQIIAQQQQQAAQAERKQMIDDRLMVKEMEMDKDIVIEQEKQKAKAEGEVYVLKNKALIGDG